MADHDSDSGLVWFLAGAALGAAGAILLAPQSGRETRERLRLRAEEGRQRLSDAGRYAAEHGRQMADDAVRSGREIYGRGRELYERGRELADETAGILGGREAGEQGQEAEAPSEEPQQNPAG